MWDSVSRHTKCCAVEITQLFPLVNCLVEVGYLDTGCEK